MTTTDTTIFSQRQIMLCLAYLAYVDEGLLYSPSLNAQIKTDLTTALSTTAAVPLQPIAGKWTLAWGPAIYTLPGGVGQLNMMYVVKCNDSTGAVQYAVVIRGTVFTELLDFFIDDFQIFNMLPWAACPGANISESINIGLTTILQMQDPVSGQTVQQFLTSATLAAGKNPVEVCFTGHSLGGTLSSTMALYMKDNQRAWDPTTQATVTTINFAALTAGDSNFANYFNTQFAYTGTTTLPTWQQPNSYADCVRNSLDVVPLVWDASDMLTIPKLYEISFFCGADIHPPLGTTEIIKKIVAATLANNYTQIMADQPAQSGEFHPESGKDKYTSEVGYQHHNAYPLLLDVAAINKLFASSKK